jgi:hypothetical protein
MSRRVSLPGAEELFRQTTTLSAVPSVSPTPVEDQPEAPIASTWQQEGGAHYSASGE